MTGRTVRFVVLALLCAAGAAAEAAGTKGAAASGYRFVPGIGGLGIERGPFADTPPIGPPAAYPPAPPRRGTRGRKAARGLRAEALTLPLGAARRLFVGAGGLRYQLPGLRWLDLRLRRRGFDFGSEIRF